LTISHLKAGVESTP